MKVGIIGLGSIARKHIDAVRIIDSQASLYALRHSPDSQPQPEITDIYTYEELIGLHPDFIIIANPTANHRPAVERLANTGIPLFIEKPLFDTLAPPPPAISHTYVACNLRFLDCLRYVKNNIANERINEVNVYCGSYLPEWRTGIDWRKCYSANKDMGGGVHIDLIHEIDYLYWLFGKPRKVVRTFRNVSSLEITACDYANYIMEYDNFTASAILNYYRRDYKRTLEIVMPDNTWLVNLAKNTVECNGQAVFHSNQTLADTYFCQMQYFVESITTKQAFNDIEEAYDVLKICVENETTK